MISVGGCGVQTFLWAVFRLVSIMISRHIHELRYDFWNTVKRMIAMAALNAAAAAHAAAAHETTTAPSAATATASKTLAAASATSEAQATTAEAPMPTAYLR